MLFQEIAQPRHDNLKRSQNWTEENGHYKMLLLLENETGRQLQFQMMRLYQSNQLTDQTRRDKRWLCNELLELRNSFFRKIFREIAQRLKNYGRICFNQLVVQIQELQDRVGSVKDAKEFCDLETACSSGLFRFPSYPTIILSLRVMSSRDSCLQMNGAHGYIRTRFRKSSCSR